MRPHGTPKQLEKRRRHAIDLLKAGHVYRQVASETGASLSSIIRWAQAYRKKGPKGLQSRPVPGRPCRMTDSQKKRLRKHLLKGPLAVGYSTDLWTLERISKLIGKLFGLHYHPGHVWRIMRDQIGWSCQKPERRSLQRDEEQIQKWKRYKWPHIKKR